jgi:hypothetical protein
MLNVSITKGWYGELYIISHAGQASECAGSVNVKIN